SADRLADVVCGDVEPVRASVVRTAPAAAARGRSLDAGAPQDESVSRSPAPLRTGPLLLVSVYDSRRTPGDRSLVAPRASGHFLSCSRRSKPSITIAFRVFVA